MPSQTIDLPPHVEKLPHVTRLTHPGRVVEAQRVTFGRWRVVSGPVVDGRPDRSVDWTEHGFHDSRETAEAVSLKVTA